MGYQAARYLVACLAAAAFSASVPATHASIEWSTYLGGSDGEAGRCVARVGDDVVVVGHTTSDDFPVTADAYDSEWNPGGIVGRDLFVARLSDDGAILRYATYLG
jgi:hypothetical protein